MISAHFDVDPSALAINKAKRCKCVPVGRGRYKPGSYTTDEHRTASDALHILAKSAWSRDGLPVYPDGAVVIEIDIYVKRMHREGSAAGLPLLDDDAPVKAIRDALEGVAYDNDAQIVQTTSRKHEASKPGIRVSVSRPGEQA